MKKTIVHVSDWHGQFYKVPYADLYIVTGDMLPNFHWTIPEREARKQTEWVERMPPLRSFFENQEATVVVVRGNHDFIDLGPCFGGDYWEISTNPERTLRWEGYKIGGLRGINFIQGYWCDEIKPNDFYPIIAKLPRDLDILVTHTPPHGILDDGFGVTALKKYLEDRSYVDWVSGHTTPIIHFFGHIHEQYGVKEVYPYKFVNSARGHHIVEID